MALNFWGDYRVTKSKNIIESWDVSEIFKMFRYVEYTKTKREFDIALPSGGMEVVDAG